MFGLLMLIALRLPAIARLQRILRRKNREEAAVGSRYAYLYLGTRVPVGTGSERWGPMLRLSWVQKPAEKPISALERIEFSSHYAWQG